MPSKNEKDALEHIENEIKSHFEEEKDLKSKISSTELKIEECKTNILTLLEENDKTNPNKSLPENIENKKINLQLLQKAKEDLFKQYNVLLNKRGNLKNVFF